MEKVMDAIAAGDYAAAYEALQHTPEAKTMIGVAAGGFLLALAERFDEADALLATQNVPSIVVIARGERQRLARWRDPSAAGSLPAAIPLPIVGFYAGMGLALLQRDEALVARIKGDMKQNVQPVAGRVTTQQGQVRPFRDLVDGDDAIGQMLETYCGEGLLYFPFAALRRVEFLPKTNFMDVLMPKVRITDGRGGTAMAFVPLLYAGSSTDAEQMTRTGRTTSFSYVGEGRRASGQRDFFLDGGTAMGLQNIAAIDFGAPN
jgi:ImpE protein